MNLETFYQKTIPVFGISTESEDQSLVLHVGDTTSPLKIKKKPVYLPSRAIIDKGVSDDFIVYHPAHEDVTKPLSLAMEATVKSASLYYSFTLFYIITSIVDTISSDEEIGQLDAKTKSLLMDTYSFPPLTRNDAQHIENFLEGVSSMEDTSFIVEFNVRKTKPNEEGLRVGTVTSRLLEAVNTAVKDDVGSIAGITMSKRSIKAFHQIVTSLLPDSLFVPVTNSRTACPAYEVIWTMAARFADVVNGFCAFINEPVERLRAVAESVNEHVIGTVAPKKLAGIIATVGNTEGNKPLKKPQRSINLNIGESVPVQQTHQPIPQTNVPQQPQQVQYAVAPPQQQAAKVESNSEYAALPTWMQTPQHYGQPQPQGYVVMPGQQYPAQGQQYSMPVAPQGQQMMYTAAPPMQYQPYQSSGYVATR